MTEAKPFCISKRAVWDAWLRVKANRGAAGVDEVSIAQFEERLKLTPAGAFSHFSKDRGAIAKHTKGMNANEPQKAKTWNSDGGESTRASS